MSANALPPLSPLPTTPATRESKNVAAQRYLQKIKPPPLKSPTNRAGSKPKATEEDTRSVSSRRSRRSAGSRKSSQKPSSARSLQPDPAESDRNDDNEDDEEEEEELQLDWAAAVGMPSPIKATPRRGKKKLASRPSEDRAAAALALCRGDGQAKKKKSSKKRINDDDAMSLSIPKSIFGQQQPQRREKDDCDASFSTLGTTESSTKFLVDPRNEEEDAVSATRSTRNKKAGVAKVTAAAPTSAGIVSHRKQELDAAIERKGIGELYEEELQDKSGHRRSLNATHLNTMGSLSRRSSRRSILELPFAPNNNGSNNDLKSPRSTASQQKAVLDPPAHIADIDPTTSSSEHSRRHLSKSPARRSSLSSLRVRRISLDGMTAPTNNPAMQQLQKRIRMLEEELMDQRREQKQLAAKYKKQQEAALQTEATALKRAHLQELDRRAIAYINETKLLENRLRSARNDLQTQSSVHQEKIQLLQDQLDQEQSKLEQAQQGHAEALGKMQSAKDELESNMEKLAAKQQSNTNKLKALHSQELQKVLEMNGELVQALQAKLKQHKLDAQARWDQDAESMQAQHKTQLQDQLLETEASHQKALKSLQDRLETEHEIAIENLQDEHKHAIAATAISQITEMQNAHAVEIESLRETLQQEHSEQLRSEVEINREAQQHKHATEIAALQEDHEMKLRSHILKEEQRRADAQASQELERLQQIKEIQSQHKEEMETLLRDLLEEHEEKLKCTIEEQQVSLTLSEEKHKAQVGKMKQELDETMRNAAIVQQEYDALKNELQNGRSTEEAQSHDQIEKHDEAVQQLQSQLETLTSEHSQKVESLQRDHDQQLETLKDELHNELKALHSNELEKLEAKAKLDKESHEQGLQELRSEFDQAMAKLSKTYELASVSLQEKSEENDQQKEALEGLKQELEALKNRRAIALESKHQEKAEQVQQLQDQLEQARSELQKTQLDLQEREESLKVDFNDKKEAFQALDLELETLKTEHVANVKSKRQEHDEHIQALQMQLQQHQQEQGVEKEEWEKKLAALEQELEGSRKEKASTLHSQQAGHDEEIEVLRAQLVQLENLQVDSDGVQLNLQETLQKQRCDMQIEKKEALEALLQELEVSKTDQTVALKLQQESHDKQLQQLQDQLDKARSDAESNVETTSEELNMLRQEKNEQIEAMQKEFEEQQKQHANQLEKASKERDEKVIVLEQQLESLVEKAAGYQAQAERLEQELQQAREELIDLKLQSDSESKEYLKGIQDGHQKELAVFQQKLDSHHAGKDNLQSQLEEKMRELTTERKKASSQMQQLECQVQEHQEQISQLTPSSTREMEDLREQLSKKEEQLQEYGADEAAQIEALKQEKDKLSHSHDEEVKLLKEKLEVQEGLTSEIDRLRTKSEESKMLQSELQKAGDERDILNATTESLNAELEILKQSIKQDRDDLPEKERAGGTVVSNSDVPPDEKIRQLEDELLCVQEEQDETRAHLKKLTSTMAALREENQKLKLLPPISIPTEIAEDPTRSDFLMAKQHVEGLETRLALAKGQMAMLATDFESETGEHDDDHDDIFRTSSSREPDRGGGGDDAVQSIGRDISNDSSDGNKVEIASSQDSFVQQAITKQKQDRSWITILGRFGGPTSSKNHESASSFESVENETHRSQLVTLQSKYKDEVYELRQRIAQLEEKDSEEKKI